MVVGGGAVTMVKLRGRTRNNRDSDVDEVDSVDDPDDEIEEDFRFSPVDLARSTAPPPLPVRSWRDDMPVELPAVGQTYTERVAASTRNRPFAIEDDLSGHNTPEPEPDGFWPDVPAQVPDHPEPDEELFPAVPEPVRMNVHLNWADAGTVLQPEQFNATLPTPEPKPVELAREPEPAPELATEPASEPEPVVAPAPVPVSEPERPVRPRTRTGKPTPATFAEAVTLCGLAETGPVDFEDWVTDDDRHNLLDERTFQRVHEIWKLAPKSANERMRPIIDAYECFWYDHHGSFPA